MEKFEIDLTVLTKEELDEAIRAIDSTIGKCDKVLPKLKECSSQQTLLLRRIKALNISSALIRRELVKHNITLAEE
ncbi:MAG: hypothetical protein WCH76_07420 [Candidatus Riflemargulisbacteria bacterium]